MGTRQRGPDRTCTCTCTDALACGRANAFSGGTEYHDDGDDASR